MARPVKNNCDYFPHDAGMRNHRKVKALRNKFPNGYSLWCMTLEHLTESDGNEFENSPSELELMAGDFGVTVTEMTDFVNFCITLELLFENNGFVFSETLNERLAPVYIKRGKAKESSKRQQRLNGKFASSNADVNGIPVTETPQTKGNKTKGEKIELEDIRVTRPIDDELFMESIKKNFPEMNYELLWGACFRWHSETPSPPILLWQWKQKFQTWLEIERNKLGGGAKFNGKKPLNLDEI